MSQVAFAEQVGVKQQTVSEWEAGKTTPSDDLRPKVAAVLGQPVHELFSYEAA